jgi:uncharacterized Zn finger protein (UPF0148 family)
MASATCPHCGEPAFSSAEFNQIWTCPTCKKTVIPNDMDNPENRAAAKELVEHYSRFWTKV